MKVMFTCGGTGGHINPALAVAGLLRGRVKDMDILFVGAEGGMETTLVPREGFELKTIKAQNLRHKLSPGAIPWNIKSVSLMMGSLPAAKKIIREFGPDVVVGTGGYACFPAVYEATRLGIPSVIHESNAIPGVTTKLLAGRVDKVLVSFEGVEGYYPKPERVAVTGMPVRSAFMLADRGKARRELGFDSRPVALSFFGSLGARDMNRAMAEVIKSVAVSKEFQLIHVTGKFGWEWMPGLLSEMGVRLEECPHIKLMEYAYNMPELMAAADLALCRAGASTLSELSVTGKPAVLIPSPNVAADHQTKNARKLEETGGVEVLPETGLNNEVLVNKITSLLRNPQKLDKMARALLDGAIFDSADRIYELVLNLAVRSGRK